MIDYFILIIRIIFSTVFILGLIVLTFKYGGGKLQSLQSKKYLKILERVSISKENNILVVKMGAKCFVVSSCHSSIEILREVPEEDLIILEKSLESPQNTNILELVKKWIKKGRVE